MAKNRAPRQAPSNFFEEPVIIFMTKIFDVILVNLLWLISSVPIFTIGASTSAMYYVTLKLVRNDNVHVFADFITGFRLTFKRATISLLFIIPILALAYLDVAFVMGNPLGLPGYGNIVFVIPIALALMVVSYILPLYAFYTDPIRNTIRNALLLTVWHLPTSIIITAVNLFPLFFMVFFFETLLKWLLMWILLGFGLISFINSYFILRVFHKDIRESDYPYIDPDAGML